MLESGWCSLLREKLAMARQVLRVADENWHRNTAPGNEGLIQGAVAMLGEARSILLKLIAETSQVEDFEGDSLGELVRLSGDDPGEIRVLEGLAQDPASWWSRLEALLESQRRPVKRESQPRSEALIAVSSGTGPDRSAAAIQSLIDEFRAYFEAFTERHDQW